MNSQETLFILRLASVSSGFKPYQGQMGSSAPRLWKGELCFKIPLAAQMHTPIMRVLWNYSKTIVINSPQGGVWWHACFRQSSWLNALHNSHKSLLLNSLFLWIRSFVAFFSLKHLKTLISKVGYKSMQLARTSVSRMVRHQCLGCPRNPNAVMRKHLFQRLFTFVLYDSELDGCKSRKGITVNNVFIHAVDTFLCFLYFRHTQLFIAILWL